MNIKKGESYLILETLSVLLEDPSEDIRNNACSALRILSDLPECYLRIVDILHDRINLLEVVFSEEAVRGLSNLIPDFDFEGVLKQSDKERLAPYSKYIKGIYYFVKKSDRAVEILVHETVNFNRKLCPFALLNDNKIYQMCKKILNKVCSIDQFNASLMQKFFENQGEAEKQISIDLKE